MGWVGTGPLHQAAASASCSWVSEACLRQAPCRGPSPRAPPFPAYGQVPREEDRGVPVSQSGPVSGPRAAPQPGKRAPSRSLCFLELDNARGFRSGAREAASSPRPSPKVNGRDTDEVSEAAPVFGEVPPWSARPSAPRPAAGVGEGTWLGMRLRASGRVSTRDTWRRVEQRRASHSPRGFPALWRALRAHVAGPGLCSGRSSLGCAVSVGPSQVAPRLWPARPREPDSATLQTLPHPPGGRRTVSPSGSCCVLGDTLYGGGVGRDASGSRSASPHVSKDTELCLCPYPPPPRQGCGSRDKARGVSDDKTCQRLASEVACAPSCGFETRWGEGVARGRAGARLASCVTWGAVGMRWETVPK